MRVSFSKFTRANFDKLNYLDPKAQEAFREFLCRIAMEGIYVRIPDSGAYRTKEEQRALYNKRPKVTWVLCPHSYHCHGVAIDLVPLWRIGPITFKALWTGDSYERIARIAMELGLEWGYNVWGVDKPHFHFSDGLAPDKIGKNGGLMVPPEFEYAEKPNSLIRAVKRMMNDGVIPTSSKII